MKFRLFVLYLILIIVFASHQIVAQEFTIKKVKLDNDRILIDYDLIDSISNRSYTINLYSSQDNFINPLTKVSGDIGLEVVPGGNRRIIWKAREELGEEFKGNIRIEVRGRLYIPFVRLNGFDDYKKFKRNKGYKIIWSGGRGDQILNFNLYKGDKKITTFPNVANVGEYVLKFDNIKPGKGYYFKIEDSKNEDDMVITETFKIRRKIPLLLKAIPLLAAGYLIYTFSEGEDGPTPIPEPIKPE